MATRKCMDCGILQEKSAYSKKQWKGGGGSRCKNCMASKHAPKPKRARFNEEEEVTTWQCSSCSIVLEKSNFSRFEWYVETCASSCKRCRFKKNLAEMERRRSNPHVPHHPDMGTTSWIPSQTMNLTSGRFCFGLEHEVQKGAKENIMTFQDAFCCYGDRFAGIPPHNTIAKNGKWVAYKLIDRDTKWDESEFHKNIPIDNRIAGWFICHEEVKDPVAEVCDVV